MVGRAIREARLKKRLTQAELALAVGLTRQHVNNIEQDRGDLPLSTAVKIARALGMAEIPLYEGVSIRRVDREGAFERIAAIATGLAAQANELNEVVREHQRGSLEARDTQGRITKLRSPPPSGDLLRFPPPGAPFTPVRVEVEEEVAVRIVGYVAAGAAIDLLNEDHGETRNVPESEAPDPRWRALEAKGDSMTEFGIYNGDLVYVQPKRGGVAAHGEIVIGWLNEGLVIKQWYRKGGVKKLVSWNAEYPDRVITKDDVWELQAIVRKSVPRAVRGRSFPPQPFPKISG